MPRTAVRWANWQRSAARNLAGPQAGAPAPTVALTFDPIGSRVVITATGLGGPATYATVDRSLDGVRWTTVRSGTAIALAGQALPDPLYDYEFPLGTVTYRLRTYSTLGGLEVTATASVATSLDVVWLKSAVRPFLNMQVSLGGGFDMQRSARGSTNEVANRALPVATTELAGSRSYDLRIRLSTDVLAQQLDFLLASGDVLFLHAPPGSIVPAGGVWLRVDADRERRLNLGNATRHRTIPVTEHAAPGPDVGYALLTWQTILSTYGTLTALLAANNTLDDLLSLLASPEEVLAE